MSDNAKKLKSKALISVISLFFQSGYSAFLGLIANLILTILLSPYIFGLYITVLSLISLLNYFSDIGLAASLIQKKEVSDQDVATTFTVQQILIITLLTGGFLATRAVKNFYNLPKEGVYLYWALLSSFFLSSLKTIPSIFLERKIQFQKIVFVQIVENTSFYVTVSILAILGFGLSSFTWAVIIRSIIGVILIYRLSFWSPKIGISFAHLKKLLTFGVPFQTASFLALFKDDLIILFLGKILGFTNLGYIGWAKKWAEAPIRIIMDNLSRVLFPLFARIQEDEQKLKNVVERFLYYQTLILAPIIIGLALMMQKIILLIPRYNKWATALPLFYIFCIGVFFSSFSTPFINLFNARGKVKISFIFMIFWTISTWILTVTLTNFYGLLGFPLTQVILSLTFVAVVFQAKRDVKFEFIKPIYPSLFASLMMGILVFIFNKSYEQSYLKAGISVALGAYSYFIFLKFVFKIDIISQIKELLSLKK